MGMRNDEVTALSKALEILKGSVKGRADAVNERALLIQKLRKPDAAAAPVKDSKLATKPAAAAPVKDSKPASTNVPKQTIQAAKAVQKAISFLQASSGLSDEDRKEQALALLTREGQRLESFALTSLAQRSAADPFKKIKGLIQKLIERLVAEATAEATKKGFCDTELGKARKDRDYRFEEVKSLSVDLGSLEAKRDELKAEIAQLTEDLEDLDKSLKKATDVRKEDKKNNLQTLKDAESGLE